MLTMFPIRLSCILSHSSMLDAPIVSTVHGVSFILEDDCQDVWHLPLVSVPVHQKLLQTLILSQ